MPPALTWSELSAGRGRVVATMVVSGRLQNRCSNLWSVKRGDACRHEHAAAVIWDWSRGNSSSDLDLRIRGRNSRGNSLSDLDLRIRGRISGSRSQNNNQLLGSRVSSWTYNDAAEEHKSSAELETLFSVL